MPPTLHHCPRHATIAPTPAHWALRRFGAPGAARRVGCRRWWRCGGAVLSTPDDTGRRFPLPRLQVAGAAWTVLLDTDEHDGRPPRLPPVELSAAEGADAADLWHALTRLAFAPPVAEDAAG